MKFSQLCNKYLPHFLQQFLQIVLVAEAEKEDNI
jgi:hypothetical protein